MNERANEETLRDQAKVDLVVSHLNPKLGIEGAAIKLANALAEAGMSVQVIALGGEIEGQGLECDGESLGSPLRGIRRLNIRRAIRARSRLRAGATSVLVGAWAALPVLALGPLRQRTIIWEHSLIEEKIASSRSLKVVAIAAKLFYRRADSIVAVSDPLRDSLRRLVRSAEVAVIPNLLDDRRNPSFRAEPLGAPRTQRREVCLSIGSLSTTKNQRALIEAMSRPELRMAEAWLAGQGPLRAELERHATELGVSERVRFLGHLDASALEYALAQANVVVHTSLGETFGYAYFEAASAHRPVVAVENSVSRWVIPRFAPGLLCSPDPGRLAEAIRRLLDAPPSAEAFRQAADERAAYFDQNRIVDGWRSELAR